jgi:hypothetical protein
MNSRAKNKTAQLVVALSGHGQEVSFLVNVILTQHSKPAAKLNGLLALVNAGHDCRTAQHAIDVLVVDGIPTDWSILEHANVLAVVGLAVAMGKAVSL